MTDCTPTLCQCPHCIERRDLRMANANAQTRIRELETERDGLRRESTALRMPRGRRTTWRELTFNADPLHLAMIDEIERLRSSSLRKENTALRTMLLHAGRALRLLARQLHEARASHERIVALLCAERDATIQDGVK